SGCSPYGRPQRVPRIRRMPPTSTAASTTMVLPRSHVLGVLREVTSERGAGLEGLPPRTVVAVPLHDVGEALFERHLRLVAELGLDLGDVYRVAQVVTEAIGHAVDVRPVLARCLEKHLGELLVGELGTT